VPIQQPPKYFLDRSLGQHQVANILRHAGLDVVTLAEHYGQPHDQRVEDVTWLKDATSNGWVCLTKDAAITRRPAEAAAIRVAGSRCFCLGSANLRADEMAGRFLSAARRMESLSTAQPGPFVYAIQGCEVKRVLA
jgi:putative N-acetylmannosamine-6-phosphate epimerase